MVKLTMTHRVKITVNGIINRNVTVGRMEQLLLADLSTELPGTVRYNGPSTDQARFKCDGVGLCVDDTACAWWPL